MGLKLLHSADWHLDTPFTQFLPEQRQYLREALGKIPQQVVSLAQREGCDAILLAGDLFDGPAATETVAHLKRVLESARMPVFITPGNHDFCCPGSVWVEESWPDNVFIFTGGLSYVDVPELQLRVYGAGYQSMDCKGLLEGFRIQEGPRYQVAVIHGDAITKGSPYCPITAAQVKHSGLMYLALGHIHKAGAFHSGDTLAAWPGCPMGRGWDETGDKGVCLVTLEDTAQVRAISIPAPRFFDFSVDTAGEPLHALEAVLPPGESQDFYRVTLTGDGPVDCADLLRAFPLLPNLDLVDRTQVPLDPWENAGEDTLEGVYFRLLRQLGQENPDQAETVQLAASISRKLLSGREVTLP